MMRLLAAMVFGSVLVAPVAAAEKPNILFLFADDFAYDAIHALGCDEIDTPHLDRLVAGGTTFTHAYNMGAWQGAVCVASRTMLITGRHLWDARRMYDNTSAELEAGRLWPQLMADAGYDTYFTGKWHIKADAERAFQTASHVRPGMPKTVPAAYNRPLAGVPDAWSPSDTALGGFWEGGRHWSEVVADDAVEFLSSAAADDDAFFMYVAFNAPHDPRQSPQEYVDRYPPARVRVPESFLAEYPFKDQIGCGKSLRDEMLAPFPRSEHAVQVHRGEYYALISHLDAQIGRILDALDESGQAGNTWILFTADHGLAVGRHGLMGKQNMYDHSVRVPFIVNGPFVTRGRRIDAAIYLQDVMPTSLELAGAPCPEHVWFQSFLPLLRNQQSHSRHEAVYGAYLDLQRAVTHDGFKLIVYPAAKTMRLYQLAADPHELHDLADDPNHAPTRDKLLARLRNLQQALNDPLDLATAQ